MKFLNLIGSLLFFAGAANTQKVLQIWPGLAPGSENWNWKEQIDSTDIPNDPLAFNIVRPTLTFYPADPSFANGTTVIICPGGSFCYLHIKTEGIDVAKWLNKKGIAAFILKYRLVRSETAQPMKEKMEKSKDTMASRNLVAQVVPLAIADAKQAIVYVRRHATLPKMSIYIISCQFFFGVFENIFTGVKLYKFSKVHKSNLV
jgi:hypothetical protein